MLVVDCCPITYVLLVTRPPSCAQSVVLLFHAIVTTNRLVPPLLPSRSGVCHKMHRIEYACVVWLYQLIVTSGHGGMPSVSCVGDIVQAVNMARVWLQWALELEAFEALSVVLAVYTSTAPRLGKRPTVVAETLRRTCRHGVLWSREGLDVRRSAVGNV